MLANTSRHNHIILLMRCLSIQLLNNLLRLHQRPLLTLLVSERKLLLPVFNIREPLHTRGRPNERDQGRQIRCNIAQDGDRSINDLVHILRLNLEMNDASLSSCSRRLCSRSKGINFACYTIVKSCAQRDNDICLLHSQIGVRGAVHTEHVETHLVQLVEGTKTLESGRYGDITLLGKLLQEFGSGGRRKDTLTCIDDRSLSLVDEIGRLLDGKQVGRVLDSLQGIGRESQGSSRSRSFE